MLCSSQDSHFHHVDVHFREVLIRKTAKNKGIAVKEGLDYSNGDSMSERRGPNTFTNELCNFRDELGNMGEIIIEYVLGDDVLTDLSDEFTKSKESAIRIHTSISWTTATALHGGRTTFARASNSLRTRQRKVTSTRFLHTRVGRRCGGIYLS